MEKRIVYDDYAIGKRIAIWRAGRYIRFLIIGLHTVIFA